jgi:long-chain fatty acid transport protein
MTNTSCRKAWTSAAVLAALLTSTAIAQAGGFAVREQSAVGQGSSFAGIAAGGAVSSMYWNPATMTQQEGLVTESSYSLLFPSAVNTPTTGSTLLPLFPQDSGNIGRTALVPASYAVWQASRNLWLGMSINAPFGLGVKPADVWSGASYARATDARTYNFAPTAAIKLSDWISIGLGLQAQYMTADFNSGVYLGGGVFDNFNLTASGWGWGWTAGVTLTPTAGTTIGLGWRSRIDQKLDGSLLVAGPVALPFTTAPVNATVKLPDIFSASIRQRVGAAFTVLGTFEYTTWGRIGTVNVLQGSGAPATVAGNPVRLPFEYKDSWFVSVGGEYAYNQKLTLRAGLGYEKSPITDAERTPRLPDSDRVWASMGFTYVYSDKLSFDAAYTHVFFKDANINITAASGNPWFNGTINYVGTAKSHLDILTVGMKYKWYTPPKAIITKG